MKDIWKLGANLEKYAKTGENKKRRDSAKIVGEMVRGVIKLKKEGVIDLPEEFNFPQETPSYTQTVNEEGQNVYNYPHTYRNTGGYIELAKSLLGATGGKDETPDEKAERERIEALKDDPEKLEALMGGLEKALDTLLPRHYEAINLRYGLDNTENRIRTFKAVGEQLSIPAKGPRANSLVKRAEKYLRHPSRFKHFREILTGETEEVRQQRLAETQARIEARMREAELELPAETEEDFDDKQ